MKTKSKYRKLNCFLD